MPITQEIMERFKENAPGTYKHCQNVSELCMAVCKELGIEEEDLVLAASVHDIGKCFNPNYFSENQLDADNPHDKLEPFVSYQIISRHVSDSVLKLIQLGAGKKVVQYVSEHHGNSLVKAIYQKAKTKYNGNVTEEHYRYKSTTPTTVEAAVLMCADVVESATRALHNAGKLKSVEDTITALLDDLIEDKQIDVLRLGELRVIRKTLITEVRNTFHKRVDYDEDASE